MAQQAPPLLWLNKLQLLQLNSLILLVWSNTGCQLPDGEVTFGALASDMADVNHLTQVNKDKAKIKNLEIVLGKYESLEVYRLARSVSYGQHGL
jgi:hypothetical protein